jgi:hypothetical protein
LTTFWKFRKINLSDSSFNQQKNNMEELLLW